MERVTGSVFNAQKRLDSGLPGHGEGTLILVWGEPGALNLVKISVSHYKLGLGITPPAQAVKFRVFYSVANGMQKLARAISHLRGGRMVPKWETEPDQSNQFRGDEDD